MTTAFQLFKLPKNTNIDSSVRVVPGAKAYFYETLSSTPQDTFTTSNLDVAHQNPVVADLNGVFPAIYLDPGLIYKLTLRTSADVLIYTIDPVNDQVLSGDIIGQFLYPQTVAEAAASLTPSALQYTPSPIDVRRFGVVPNDASARSANDTAMKALFNSDVVGPQGVVMFVPEAGNDIYYFGDFFPSRANIYIEGNGCKLSFSRTYVSADDSTGFIYAINNLSIRNLEIEIDYDASTGTHAGNAITFGQRNDAGSYFIFGFEEDLPHPMGQFYLHNVRITMTTANPVNDGAILLLGGVKNLIMENCVVDCGATGGADGWSYGVIGEFGYYSDNGVPLNDDKWSSSHMSEGIFRNCRFGNLDTSFGEGAAISLIGGIAIIENCRVNKAYHGFESRPGEALWFRVGPDDEAIKKQGMHFRNVSGINITNSGIVCIGAESASTGTLSAEIAALGHPADYIAQTNLMTVSIDGFRFPDADIGINVSCNCIIKNGYIEGFSSSGGIRIAPDSGFFDISNVKFIGGAGAAIEASIAYVIASSAIKLRGRIYNCKFGACNSIGIALANCDGVTIENNEIGYATVNGDAADEAVMTQAVNLASTARHVAMRNNYVKVAGGGTAYVSAGSGDRGNDIVGPMGDLTHTASLFMLDGVARAGDVALAAKANVINTDNKYLGKLVWDSTNNRIYYALGSTDVSQWGVLTAAGVVTPS